MDEITVVEYITAHFDGVEVATHDGYTFFFYGEDHRLPFATLANRDDEYDRASNLDRPSIYRLNIGVSPETFRSLFEPVGANTNGVAPAGHDFTVLDELLPHPVYAPQSWVCVLNPGTETFEALKPLLAEAHDRAVRRSVRAGRGSVT